MSACPLTAVVNLLIGDVNGATPLFVASQKGHFDVVKALLEAGANANQG